MNDEQRHDIALFRYGLIAPVLHGTHAGCAADYFRLATAEPLTVPHVGAVHFKPDTLKGWLADFRARGLDGLMPKPRADLGTSRVVTPEQEARLRALLAAHPRMSATLAWQRLVDEGVITGSSPSDTSIRRFIRAHGLRVTPPTAPTERHAWSKGEPNELWTLDFMRRSPARRRHDRAHACSPPSTTPPASSCSVASCPSESYADLAPALVDAFLRHGVPQAIYCDNGAAFSTRDLALACARLDVALIHSAPYVPQSRGKVERFFGTVRSRFLAAFDPAALASISSLDAAFTAWLDADYHRRVHSALDVPPLARFLDSSRPKRWISRQELDLHFYRTLRRLVRADCTVSVDGVRYEVTPEWIGHTVELRAPLDSPSSCRSSSTACRPSCSPRSTRSTTTAVPACFVRQVQPGGS